MATQLTLFTATLVQDTALSVSGIDRETSADRSFVLVNGVPTLPGRGLKGAAVAMAKRFFNPLPRAVSDDIKHGALRRSLWEFADTTATGTLQVRAGVGIRHRTGARAGGVLYDREVMPAGTRWPLRLRVDRSFALNDDEFHEAEGILGYVLAEHWAKERCWLGAGPTRGLGWCHVEDLKAYRFDAESYEQWVRAGRPDQPAIAPVAIPAMLPTRAWCFRTLDVDISFGAYTPEADQPAWGLDMLAVGPHNTERAVQPKGDGAWARPAWALESPMPENLATDRALLMDGNRPVLPGASVRGPLRHAFSREERQAGRAVADPHLVQGDVGADDTAGQAFGTVHQSSRIRIRDAHANEGWAAAKLHMHAEDEFSASSYGSAKRDAVRLLQASFPVRIVVEGATPEEVEPLMHIVDRQVALGTLGHQLVGGHKTRGAGAGTWRPRPWEHTDVEKKRDWAPTPVPQQSPDRQGRAPHRFPQAPAPTEAWVTTNHGPLTGELTLGEAARLAKAALGDELVAWWCDLTIDLSVAQPPHTFGRSWPAGENNLRVDEVSFYARHTLWKAARTANGARFVHINESDGQANGATPVRVVHTPARLHAFNRFSAANTGTGQVLLREWHTAAGPLGFTIQHLQD